MEISQFAFCIIFLANIVEGKMLKCYTCDSRQDGQCGETFGYTKVQAENKQLITTCKEGQVCRKTTVEDFAGTFVVRECVESVITGCREMRRDGQVCDCIDKLCNSTDIPRIYFGLLIAVMAVQRLLLS
ncbi:uncharacterized protein LOC127701583 [Mytilus californianus]|uniref:uncharacterized protein LOC127701583 n=1 Tax=Mytilus californianus TaxID=6549 RepID=UPI0022485744|nr:uncharacterized protein LOC127701583 [Mytilus californianus]